MDSRLVVPGYETTYNYFYKSFCEKEKEIKYEKYKPNLVNLYDLEEEEFKKKEILCKCNEISEIKKFGCDIKAWDYLANTKTEYTDKICSVWAHFPLKALIPKKVKSGIIYDPEFVTSGEPTTYIHALEDNKNPKKMCWWLDKLGYSDDLQCRISREYKKRQFYLTEKIRLQNKL